jgi:CO/xanthine dehydrogenase FAD-binding subunit
MSVADLPRYDMRQVGDLEALCALLHEQHEASQPVVMLAGGTDFMVELSQGGRAPDPLPLVVDVSRLHGLRGISFADGVLRIGAAATYLEIQRNPHVQQHTPPLVAMTYDVGGPTIQARGTLGGNLATASPAADGVAAIAPYDPVIVLKSVRGERRVPFGELQTGYKTSTRAPDEAIVAVEITVPAAGSIQQWRKVGTRSAQAISKVAMGALAEVDDGTITRCGFGLASVAPVTALMPATRALAVSKPVAELTAAAIDAAVASDIQPIDDIRSTSVYRLHVAKAIVRGFLRDVGAPV